MIKLPDHLVVIGLRFEKAVAAYLKAAEGHDAVVLVDAIIAYGHVLQVIEDLPTTDDRMALTRFLYERGNVPEGITARVQAEMERLSCDIDRPRSPKSQH
jgi:hypothetical protein